MAYENFFDMSEMKVAPLVINPYIDKDVAFSLPFRIYDAFGQDTVNTITCKVVAKAGRSSTELPSVITVTPVEDDEYTVSGTITTSDWGSATTLSLVFTITDTSGVAYESLEVIYHDV